jgi:hypothetical protein
MQFFFTVSFFFSSCYTVYFNVTVYCSNTAVAGVYKRLAVSTESLLLLWINSHGERLELVSKAQLARRGALVQRGHQLPVVLGHVDVELLQGGQAVEFRGMRA